MVAYSFQPQFVDPIRSGRKRQTIRAIGRRRHALPGEALQLYTGMRTRSCRLIGRAACDATTSIEILFRDRYPGDAVRVGAGPKIWQADLDPFAQDDGFRSWAELRAFWDKHHGDIARFSGVLIRWTTFEPA